MKPELPSVVPGLLAWISAEVNAGGLSVGSLDVWLDAALTKQSNRPALTNARIIIICP
jgi:hypothetical protein